MRSDSESKLAKSVNDKKTEKKRIEELRKNGTHEGMLRARGNVARRPSFLDSPGFGLGLKPSEENDEPRQRAISPAPETPCATSANGTAVGDILTTVGSDIPLDDAATQIQMAKSCIKCRSCWSRTTCRNQ